MTLSLEQAWLRKNDCAWGFFWTSVSNGSGARMQIADIDSISTTELIAAIKAASAMPDDSEINCDPKAELRRRYMAENGFTEHDTPDDVTEMLFAIEHPYAA